MTDSLTIFGDDFTGVTGIKATGTGNGTLTYIRPQGTKSISSNGTGIDVTEYAAVDVAVSGGGDSLIVTLSWDDDYFGADDGAWVPDCTVYELQDAYASGKEIAFVGENGEPATFFYDDDYVFIYSVFADSSKPNTGRIIFYELTVQGVSFQEEVEYIYPNFESLSLTYTPSTSQQTDTVTYDPNDGYNGIQQVSVTVNAMPTGTAGTPTATKGTVSNHAVAVTPSVINTTGYITGGTKTGTAVTVSASELVSGSQTITENDTYDVTNLASVTVNVSGGSGGLQVATATATPSSASASISFTGLSGEPTSFYIVSDADLATGSSPWKTAAVVYDGTSVIGQTITNTSNAQVTFDDDGFSYTYVNGTLTVTGTGTRFQANQYTLTYTYGGGSGNIGTSDVQVGSGATSITFTNLPDEPTCWSCIFKSNFSTSSGYTRAIVVVNDGSSIYGMEMGSGAQATSHWTASYSNGSLTISSQSTSAGGYFHQPNPYQLTYAIGGTVDVSIEPLSVTQNGTYQESGKAYSPVTVNVSGGGSWTVKQETWSNNSTSTVSHQFTGLSGTPKAAILRCTSQLTRSSSNTYYYITDIIWDGTDAWGNYHLRSNGTFNNVAKDAASGFNVSTGTNSITFSSDASSRSSAPGSFYNGTYELTYWY